jgi:hypothetical protein
MVLENNKFSDFLDFYSHTEPPRGGDLETSRAGVSARRRLCRSRVGKTSGAEGANGFTPKGFFRFHGKTHVSRPRAISGAVRARFRPPFARTKGGTGAQGADSPRSRPEGPTKAIQWPTAESITLTLSLSPEGRGDESIGQRADFLGPQAETSPLTYPGGLPLSSPSPRTVRTRRGPRARRSP